MDTVCRLYQVGRLKLAEEGDDDDQVRFMTLRSKNCISCLFLDEIFRFIGCWSFLVWGIFRISTDGVRQSLFLISAVLLVGIWILYIHCMLCFFQDQDQDDDDDSSDSDDDDDDDDDLDINPLIEELADINEQENEEDANTSDEVVYQFIYFIFFYVVRYDYTS